MLNCNTEYASFSILNTYDMENKKSKPIDHILYLLQIKQVE